MPLRSAAGTVPGWDDLHEEASSQAGYFTARQAAAHHISHPLLRHHVAAGHLEKAGRGIFRFRRFPRGPHDEFVVVWLWSDGQGVFSHETALMLHELSDALPARLHLTVPAAWTRRRLKVPRGVVLHFRDVSDAEREWKGPVPLTTPLRTLMDMATDMRSPELAGAAVREARARGLLTERQVQQAAQMGIQLAGDVRGDR